MEDRNLRRARINLLAGRYRNSPVRNASAPQEGAFIRLEDSRRSHSQTLAATTLPVGPIWHSSAGVGQNKNTLPRYPIRLDDLRACPARVTTTCGQGASVQTCGNAAAHLAAILSLLTSVCDPL
jgi:hypothetical protein